MKRFTIILCVLVMTFTVTSCRNVQNGTPIESTDETQATNKAKQIIYNDDDVLFMCSDRYDNDDDSTIPYKYNWKGELIDDTSYVGYFAENGLAPALDPIDGNTGYINKTGEFIIDPIYSEAGPFSKYGLAAVAKQDENGKEKWGFIQSDGKQVVECKYDWVSSFFPSGYAIIITSRIDGYDEYGFEETTELFGIIDKNLHVVIEPKYAAIRYLYEKYFIASEINEELKIYDYNGNVLDSMDTTSDISYYKKEKDGIYKYVYKDSLYVPDCLIFDGKTFVEVKKEYTISDKKVATTKSGIAFGVTKGNETVIPFEYDRIREVNEYFIAIKYIDAEGKKQEFDIYNSNYEKTAENIEYNFFASIYDLPSGYFEICLDTLYNEDHVCGIINEKGEIIIEPVFCGSITPCTYEATGLSEFCRY